MFVLITSIVVFSGLLECHIRKEVVPKGAVDTLKFAIAPTFIHSLH